MPCTYLGMVGMVISQPPASAYLAISSWDSHHNAQYHGVLLSNKLKHFLFLCYGYVCNTIAIGSSGTNIRIRVRECISIASKNTIPYSCDYVKN